MIQNYFRGDQVAIFAKWLRWAKNFVILTHISPDGDAIGSSLAMAGYLKNKGKNVKVVVPNDFPDYYLVAGGAENIIVFSETKQYIDLISKTDVIVCLDFNETGRVSQKMNFRPAGQTVFNAISEIKILEAARSRRSAACSPPFF